MGADWGGGGCILGEEGSFLVREVEVRREGVGNGGLYL